MNDTTTQADAHVFDVRPATAWLNDIQKQITVGGAKHFRGQNPEPGTAISYWLKGNADDVRVSITDITGREIRVIDGPKTAGLHRVRWDMRAGAPPGRGAPARAPARPRSRPRRRRRCSRRRRTRRRRRRRRASRAPRREDRPRRRPRRRAPGAARSRPRRSRPHRRRRRGGGGGRGRGGFGPALPAGRISSRSPSTARSSGRRPRDRSRQPAVTASVKRRAGCTATCGAARPLTLSVPGIPASYVAVLPTARCRPFSKHAPCMPGRTVLLGVIETALRLELPVRAPVARRVRERLNREIRLHGDVSRFDIVHAHLHYQVRTTAAGDAPSCADVPVFRFRTA